MADEQGARPSPESPLPLRVIRSGKIVYHVGSLAELVTLAATDKLSPIDEIDGLQPGNPIDLQAVPEIARALAEREDYWLRRHGRAYTIAAMFYGLLVLIVIGPIVRKWWAGELSSFRLCKRFVGASACNSCAGPTRWWRRPPAGMTGSLRRTWGGKITASNGP